LGPTMNSNLRHLHMTLVLRWLSHLGPLHTQAKSRDHEIVRAQKKVSKGRPKTPSKSCSVVTDPQV
jgi:hypothetical protein